MLKIGLQLSINTERLPQRSKLAPLRTQPSSFSVHELARDDLLPAKLAKSISEQTSFLLWSSRPLTPCDKEQGTIGWLMSDRNTEPNQSIEGWGSKLAEDPQLRSRLTPSSTSDQAMTTAYGPTVVQDVPFGYGPQDRTTHPSILHPGPRPSSNLDILSYSPARDQPGTEISVLARSGQDLRRFPAATFTLSFAETHVPAVMQTLGSDNGFFQYAFVATIPSLGQNTWEVTVPLSLHFEDTVLGVFASMGIGFFTFGVRASAQMEMSDPRRLSNRRGESDLVDPRHSPNPGSSLGAPYQTGHRAPMDRRGSSFTSAAPNELGSESVSSSGSPVRSSVASPSTTGIRPSRRPVHSSSSHSPDAPPLVRTSTIRQPATISSPLYPLDALNPYSAYPNSKAQLQLDSDLDLMAENWTEEEHKVNRRLVEFERHQDGSTIYTSFKPVALNSRKTNGICISCIWWEERGEAFVTSVDTIYLLESLVAVRFTVEEKNRIRRNLEGFHPLTVSKSKSDSEDFFSIIMGFPDPKPRNIEKDVKVFPWKSLKPALNKIIGKYSATYTSPTGPYATSVASSSGSNAPTGGAGQRSATTNATHILPSATDSRQSNPFVIPTPEASRGMLQQGYVNWPDQLAMNAYGAQNVQQPQRPGAFGPLGDTVRYTPWEPDPQFYESGDPSLRFQGSQPPEQ